MSALSTVYRAGSYNGPPRYASSGYGDTEKLLRDLRSELLIEKEKRLIAENIASDLEKQLRELQGRTRTEGNWRRDAENRIRHLELQLRAETDARKKAETSRDQLLLRRVSADLLPLDRASGGRNFNGVDRVEDERQGTVETNVRRKSGYPGALQRISSSDYNAFCNDKSSSSSNYNNNGNDNDVDDKEWQLMVRKNEDILQKSGPTVRTNIRRRISRKYALKKSASESTERRNIIAYLKHQHESQGTGPAADHTSRRPRDVRENTHSPEQVSIGRAGGSGHTQMVEQVSKREGRGNTPVGEYVNRGGAYGNGIVRGAEHNSMKGKSSNWPTSERSLDEIRRTATSNDKHDEFPSKKLLVKKVSETQTEAVQKGLHQNSATSTVYFKNPTDVTDFSNWSSLGIGDHNETWVQTDDDVDPAFTTGKQRRLLWQQRDSFGQTDLHVQSPGGVALENGKTGLPIQRFMKLKAKWGESTQCSSEA